MKHLLRLIIIFICMPLTAQLSHPSVEKDFKPFWVFGGGLGLAFGNHQFGIQISPVAGKRISEKLEIGAKAGYQYNNYKDYYSMNAFAAGPYVNFYVLPQFFVHSNYAYHIGTVDYKNTDFKNQHFNESALWIGGGYQSLGKVGYRLGLNYNLLYKENKSHFFSSAFSPYAGLYITL